MINKLNDYFLIKESAARIPDNIEYWKNKGKQGKKVCLFIHDDLDGIYCGILMRKYLLNHGFEIVKYGILNYTEGWKYTTIDPTLINVVLDFANMPGDDRDEYIDFYLDHHGDFTDSEKEKYKKSPVQKLHTGSAYEALCIVLGLPQDKLTVHVIDMVDAAKYTEYNIDWQRLLKFDLEDIKKTDKIRLEFAAAFNQFIKRADSSTLIEVVDNCNDASIYAIYLAMKKLYPKNNPYPTKVDGTLKKSKNELTGQWESPTKPYKDFVEDRTKTLGIMNKRTSGIETTKKKYSSYDEFMTDFGIDKKTVNSKEKYTKIKILDSYKIIGNLAFIPSDTWANALRARVIIEKDIKSGRLHDIPKFILLDFGNTLQICSFKKIEITKDLPTIFGVEINDLGKYMNRVLDNFKKPYIIENNKNIGGGLGYHSIETKSGLEDEVTVAGGHNSIGSISNITGVCTNGAFNGVKFIDIFKNKIIMDLSGVKFDLNTSWQISEELPKNKWMLNNKDKEPLMNNKIRNIEDVRTITPSGQIVNKFKK